MKKTISEEEFLKFKKQIGITLVALVVTIIVLLILAGITVAQLSGSGLFDSVKLAKEKYKGSQDLENSVLSDYENATLNGIVSTRDGDTNPVGTIIAYMGGTTAPENYLACDGSEKNIADYPKLAAQFETGFGSKNKFGGDGTTTFKVPDLQGEFLRGTGTNSHTDGGQGENVGIHQSPTLHIHVNNSNSWNFSLYASSIDNADTVINYSGGRSYCNRAGTNTSINVAGNYTSRPTNTSVLYCIKAK